MLKLADVVLANARRAFMVRTGFLGLLFCAHVAIAASLASDSAVAPLSFDVWPVEDGWQQDSVTAIVQSHNGYLWMGTYSGLVRFDGVHFTIFDSSTAPGLKNSRVTSLYEDHLGVLWIGHETGELTQFGSRFQSVNPGPAWPGGSIEAITEDEANGLWLLNDNGVLFRVGGGELIQVPGASPAHKASLTRDEHGKIWIVTNGRVATLEGGRLIPVYFDDPTQTSFYERIIPSHDGGLWVASGGRLRKWLDAHWEEDLGDCPCGQGLLSVMLETRSGALLAGTLHDGLYVLSRGAKPAHFDRSNGLTHDWVRSLCEDHEGNIWVGTGGGLDTLRTRKIRMLDSPDRWQGCAVTSFIVRPEGTAWIGTEGAGLYHYDYQGWTNFTEANGLPNAFIWSVLETHSGELWIGTWGGGLVVKNGERFESPGELSRITAPVVSLCEGRHDEIWIGTVAGLYCYKDGKLTWSAGKDKLKFPDVRTILVAPDSTVWFGMSGGGLGQLKDGELKQFRRKDGLSSDFVQCLLLDSDGALWIGTSDHGLARWKDGHFASIGIDQGLPSAVICHIVDDCAGGFWMGSHRGILRVSKTELNLCADGKQKSIHCLSYGRAEGLASQTCSGGFQPGACRTGEGQLWFPTAKGIAIVDPAKVKPNLVQPPVVIEEFLVDGQPVEAIFSGPGTDGTGRPAVLRIPAGKQRFEIRYTGLSFMAPDKVRFKYMLRGLDPDWVDAGTKRFAPYSFLAPDTYEFQVTACNNDGIWSDTGASFAFSVAPYFYQTWWFRLVALGAGAGAVSLGVLGATRRRVRRKLEQLERQRAVERERARIARDIHDDLGASLTRITMLSQSVRTELEKQPQVAADVDQIYETARELTRAMDEIVWAVNPKHETLDSLVTYLGRFAQNFLSAAQIRCRIDVPVHLPPWAFTSQARHNVFLAFKEALHNVVKHAGASEVRISLELLRAGFVLVIADNGHGFDLNSLRLGNGTPGDTARLSPGNGVLNMQRRLEEVSGRCEWETAPEQGTRVKFSLAVTNQASSKLTTLLSARNEL